MEPLVRQLLEEVRQHRLFQPNESVVVAVSGGVDSVFLLHLLQQLQGIPLRLIVAHLNHQLRGEESDGDAAFVADLARNQGLPFELAVEDVAQIARLEKLSLEDAGRRARYTFLNAVADRFGARVIALGHHADDQAETFLMRLLRGAGSSGLGGMMISSRDGRYVRPLLSVTREHIVTAARKAGLLWCEDASNADVTYLRNRLRHELLPLLRSYNPAIDRTLVATAELIGEDGAYLDDLARDLFLRLSRQQGANSSFDIGALQQQPRVMRSRIYRQAVRYLQGDLRRLTRRHLEDIDGLLASPEPCQELSLPSPLHVWKEYGTLRFGEDKSLPTPWELTLSGPGSYNLPHGGLLRITPGTAEGEGRDGVIAVQRIALSGHPFPWTLRSFHPGDRIRLPGLTGRKKVKELLAEERIPPWQRMLVPLLFSLDELIWVIPLRTAASIADKEELGGVVTVTYDPRGS